MVYFPLFSLHIRSMIISNLFTVEERVGVRFTAFPREFHKNCEITSQNLRFGINVGRNLFNCFGKGGVDAHLLLHLI